MRGSPPSRTRTAVIAIVTVAVATTVGVVTRGSEDLPKRASTEPPEALHDADADEGAGHNGERDPAGERPPATPRLIGMTPAEVEAALDPLDLTADFQGQCKNSTPGRVVVQTPDPGDRVGRLGLLLWTDRNATCSRRVASRSCSPADITVTGISQLTVNPGATNPRNVGFSARNVGDSACQLRTEATIEIRDRRMAPAMVRGNPGHFTVDSRLAPRADDAGILLWRNWCAPSASLRLVISIAGFGETVIPTRTPGCEQARRPSLMY